MEKAEKQLNEFVGTSLEYLKKHNELASEYLNNHLEARLNDVLKEFLVEIEKRHKIDAANNGDKIIVIHYTSIAALVSMLTDVLEQDREQKEELGRNREKEPKPIAYEVSPTLRLYDSVHLNDPDEGNYLVRHLNKKYSWLKEEQLSHAYISSFIHNKEKDMSDNLVFWRTYGKEGKGCSLSVHIPYGKLQRVLYGDQGVRSTIDVLTRFLKPLDAFIKGCKKPLRNDVGKKLAEIVCKFLEKIRYLYKSDAYDYEKECRVVIAETDISEKNKIRFEAQGRNNSSTRLRHYYEDNDLKIRNLLSTGCTITLGPCVSQPYNVRYYLYSLMKRANLTGPKIRISEIPYRKS